MYRINQTNHKDNISYQRNPNLIFASIFWLVTNYSGPKLMTVIQHSKLHTQL